METRYYLLDAEEILQTIERLSKRISERFPESGLFKVSRRLRDVTAHAGERSDRIARPLIGLRVGVIALIAALLGATAVGAFNMRLPGESLDATQFLTVLEPGLNVVILIGAAVLFLFTVENRVKRRRALAATHELRAIAHVIDMHQLTKNPERLRSTLELTPSTPDLSMTPHELSRYLDFCSEMLSLVGKVAALYVQRFEDSVSLTSANDVETLCTGLSRKIWQKIMILQQM